MSVRIKSKRPVATVYSPSHDIEKRKLAGGTIEARVRDGRVAWTQEFGVTNVLTGKPVTPASTFKVASNSKVVTAYIALRLVDQGERMRMYQQADGVLVEEAPVLPLHYGRFHLLVKPWVRKYPTSPIRTWFWKDVIIEPH